MSDQPSEVFTQVNDTDADAIAAGTPIYVTGITLQKGSATTQTFRCLVTDAGNATDKIGVALPAATVVFTSLHVPLPNVKLDGLRVQTTGEGGAPADTAHIYYRRGI
jgi:hypothetical protein